MQKEYTALSKEELTTLYQQLTEEYNKAKVKKLNLNMARGKPSAEQTALSLPMLDILTSESAIPDTYANYGMLDGIPEAKELLSHLLEVDPALIFVGGNASLTMMHDCFSMAYLQGFPESVRPWCQEEQVKILCPSPGYDRHFAIAEHFGATLIPVAMTAQGPNMDEVEELVKDSAVKGIWCVPKYSNPTGITYSDDTVRRLAKLSPSAKDFKIFYDNAYSVHHLDNDKPDTLLNIMEELTKIGHENMILMFCSTAKLTFPGAGISGMASGKKMIAYINEQMAMQTISYDKLNQLRHARFLPTKDAIVSHMAKHAALLAPKFESICTALATLDCLGIVHWNRPKGGYFISLDVMEGCAKRVVLLCKEAGVLLTPAGATFPYGNDARDTNIRIAPSFPPLEELEQAGNLLCLCTKLATVEKLLG